MTTFIIVLMNTVPEILLFQYFLFIRVVCVCVPAVQRQRLRRPQEDLHSPAGLSSTCLSPFFLPALLIISF